MRVQQVLNVVAWSLRTSTRRWLVLVPMGISALFFLGSFPRILIMFDDASRTEARVELVGRFVSFAKDGFVLHLLTAEIVGITLGASLAGGRRAAASAVLMLSRPVRRSEWVLGRFLTALMLGSLIWIFGLLVYSGIGLALGMPPILTINIVAATFAGQAVTTAMGTACGSRFSATPAAIVVLGLVISTYKLQAHPATFAVARFVTPPLRSLIKLCEPFASWVFSIQIPVLLAQASLWTAALVAVAIWFTDSRDFTVRDV